MERDAAERVGNGIQLRDVEAADLPAFFEQQLDPEANRMAAFTTKDPADEDAFRAHWDRLLGSETVVRRTVLLDGQVAGHVLSFEQEGKREVTYWLGKEYWGRGVATGALQEFLGHETTRPLYARAAKDNAGSIRVLQKSGFEISGEDIGYANARGQEVEEFILVLRGHAG